jgi:hypothetical protein
VAILKEGFSTRVILSMVNDQIAAEAHMARVGVHVRALAKEHRVAMPERALVGEAWMSEEIVSMYEVLDALEAVIKAADPDKRNALAEIIDDYAEHYPEDFFWATGAQSPTLLSHLMMVVDSACRPEAQSKPRPTIRLVDRKPEGSA